MGRTGQNRIHRRYADGTAAKSAGGILFLGDISQYSKNIQQGIHFLLGKAEKQNVRIICACSSPSDEWLQNPAYDPKLFTLLSSLKLQIPPLREQAGDIAFLINRIATELSETQKIPVARFSDGALELLTGYDWPGNFDQLHNVVKTLALSAGEGEIDEAAVANELGLNKPEKNRKSTSAAVLISACPYANCGKSWSAAISNTTSLRKAKT